MYWQKQNDMLAQRKTSDDQIAFQTHIQGQRMYSCCADKDEFAKFILSQPFSYCNELLYSDCYSYVDLDSPNTLQELGFSDEIAFIQVFTDILISAHKEHLGVTLRPGDILWSCSTRPSKTSYHIKINCDHYWRVADRAKMKDFYRNIDQICLDTDGLHFWVNENSKVTKHSILDLSVYSTNRCFRTVGSSKHTNEVKFCPVDGRITHSSVVQNLFTVTNEERARLTPFEYKEAVISVPKVEFHSNILEELAKQYSCKVEKIEGNLVILSNIGCRICPINKETNESDNAFFVLKNENIFYGCHNSDCAGKLHPIHKLNVEKTYQYYEDYKKLLHKKDVKMEDIQKYMIECVSFIDRPSEPLFVVKSKCGVSAFNNQVHTIKTDTAKTLFKNYQDITLFDNSDEKEPEVLKFSKILNNLLTVRRIPTYTSTIWLPYLAKNPPKHLNQNQYNLFTGFALEKVPSNELDFTTTQIFDLITKLGGKNVDYLLNFLAYKLQFPSDKKPIGLCFINSKPGQGKGSFGIFLERLFACDSNSYVAFNNLDSFSNGFNGIMTRALFICLEEITAKRNCLRAFNGLLKDRISSCQIMEEIKCRERVLRPWFANILIYSNDFNVMSCAKNDRRLVFFESDDSKANNKAYFVKLYEELADIKIMKSAFEYFSNRDTSTWNYRHIPKTHTKDKLILASERHSTKFHRYLLTECLTKQNLYRFTAENLYDYYRNFCEDYGMSKRYDRTYVITNFELHMDMKQVMGTYSITARERLKKLTLL